jgi:hypothetical protein
MIMNSATTLMTSHNTINHAATLKAPKTKVGKKKAVNVGISRGGVGGSVIDAKKNNVLERNRLAASRCREKKKRQMEEFDQKASQLKVRCTPLYCGFFHKPWILPCELIDQRAPN